ncbi:hypothetical protein E3P99_03470 [Wallemia hederae]|uniref:AB hydrolase-1 domain-containing protein n=1 Tax=Wallemia hederae TaxID=1540922 RepID=A0A4T0FF93_9BASI|nr:hypothetical protein E3P99_03470 [Wallemia hederae]
MSENSTAAGMPPYSTVTLKDGSTVAYNLYNKESSKTPLVMIMGMTGCMLDWQAYSEALSRCSDRPVLIFDNRNIGNSFGDISNLSLDLMVSDTIELISMLGLSEVHLLGFSMGGMIAQQMLLHHSPPFAISKVILSSTACRRPPATQIDMSSLEGVQAFTLSLFDDEWIANNQAILAIIKESSALTRRPLETMQGQAKALGGFDLTDDLKQRDFTNKLYVMHGKRDAIIKFEEAEHLLTSAKGARMANLPSLEYGHFFSAYFDPETWSAVIEECLQQDADATANL